MKLFDKMFGTYSERLLKKFDKTIAKIDEFGKIYEKMSDAELQAMTPAFKERLRQGETLDDLLPEAFALSGKPTGACFPSAPSGFSFWAASSCIRGRSPK